MQEIPYVSKYQQWYDRDEDLLSEEQSLLADKNIEASCNRLPDGRVNFVTQIDNSQVAVICSYNHPLQPPEVIVMDDVDPSVADESGKVDLFAHDGFEWSPETRVCDVVGRIKTLLSIASQVGTVESKTDKPEE